MWQLGFIQTEFYYMWKKIAVLIHVNREAHLKQLGPSPQQCLEKAVFTAMQRDIFSSSKALHWPIQCVQGLIAYILFCYVNVIFLLFTLTSS